MSLPHDRDDRATLIAVGAAVAIGASLAHEVLGHGLGCRIDGGTVSLLTFLVFRCNGGGAATDAGGPVGALLVAGLCLLLLRLWRPRPSAGALFVYALGVQTLLWVCAQMVREGIDGSDDWGHAARALGWPWLWHPLLVAAGVLGYGVVVRIATSLGQPLAQGRPARLLIPYAATCAAAVILAALWRGGAAASAWDAFLCFGIAPLGYLVAIRRIARAGVADGAAIGRNWAWCIGVAVVCLGMVLTVARGMGRLA